MYIGAQELWHMAAWVWLTISVMVFVITIVGSHPDRRCIFCLAVAFGVFWSFFVIAAALFAIVLIGEFLIRRIRFGKGCGL